MIPIVCFGCSERAEIPFIPPDLTCVACKTGDHIDLDDADIRTLAAGSPSGYYLFDGGEPADGPYETATEAQAAAGSYRKANPAASLQVRFLERGEADMADHNEYPDDHYASRRAMLNDLPMGLLHDAEIPDQDRDMDELSDDGKKRKVTVPKGSTPYTQRALASRLDPSQAALSKAADLSGIRNLLAQFNGKNVTITYDDDLGLHTVAGPLTYHPPAVMVGQSATTEVHVLQITVNGYGDYGDDGRTGEGGSIINTLRSAFPSGATAAKTAAYNGLGRAESVEDVLAYHQSMAPGKSVPLNSFAFALQCDNATARRKLDAAIERGTVQTAGNPNRFTLTENASAVRSQQDSDDRAAYQNTPSLQDPGKGGYTSSKTADAWDHGLGDSQGRVFSCFLDMDCPFTGTAAEMEQHYATSHLDSINRELMQGVANPQRTKVSQIAAAVMESNPGMSRQAALQVAVKTVQRYPKVALDSGPDKTKGQMTRQCESCKNRWETNVLAPGAIEPCPQCGHEYSTRTNKRPHDAPAGV